MHEPPIQFGPGRDARPVWVYVIVVFSLRLLPWFGVECLFGWCVVQGDDWIPYAFMLALPVLLLLEFPLRLLDKARGVEKTDWEDH